jgi:Lrp/AsnC family leucine-responsive transcriptional regulator
MIDDIDRQLLDILQSDGRTSNAELARRVGMAPSAVFERVRRLEQKGVIAGYGAHIDPRIVERSLLAFVLVRSDEHAGSISTGEALANEPDVLEVHHVAGQDSYLVKVRVRDPESLGRLLRERFGAIPGVRSTQSTIALETMKESWSLPVNGLPRLEKVRG